MKKYWRKKIKVKYLFLLLLLCLSIKDVEASPWGTPDDVLLKHDLQILTDAGLLNIPLNTWPIAWGDVAYNLKADNPKELSPETLLSLQRIKQRLIEEQMGGISANAEIKVSKNPDRIMTFFDPVNVKKIAASNVSYMSKNLAINLKYEKTDVYELLDESHISLARGNYSMTLGSKKNWWGPGWMGSTALSTNARPIKGLSIERNFSDPSVNASMPLALIVFIFMHTTQEHTLLLRSQKFEKTKHYHLCSMVWPTWIRMNEYAGPLL